MTEADELDMAYSNSFKIIILDYDWEEIVEGKYPFFAHNIARRFPKKYELERLINHFLEKEDYIKCKSLKEYLERVYEKEG